MGFIFFSLPATDQQHTGSNTDSENAELPVARFQERFFSPAKRFMMPFCIQEEIKSVLMGNGKIVGCES